MPALLLLLAVLMLAAPADAGVPRIVGGDGTPNESLPYMASLIVPGRQAREGHFCGGSVIAPTVVMTAAHCVADTPPGHVDVVTGRTYLSDENSGQLSNVATIAVHPGWDGTNNDIAVVHLKAPVSVQPVALATGGRNEQAVVAGWGISERGGISDQLRAVELPIATTFDCRDAFGSAFRPDTMVCAGGEDGRDSCSGDSGGPLLAAGEAAAAVQIGIVSFGSNPCGQRGVPGVYTRVSAYGAWLASVTGGGTQPPPATEPASVRIGRIRCGRVFCRVEVRTQGELAAVRVSVRNRVAQARPAGAGRWIATLRLPYGNSTVTASPLRADGTLAGRTARVPIRVT